MGAILLPSPLEGGRVGDGGDMGSGSSARRQLPPPVHPHPWPLPPQQGEGN